MPAMQQGFLILTPALTLTPALSQPGLISLTGATYPGEGDRRAVGLTGGGVWVWLVPPFPSGFPL